MTGIERDPEDFLVQEQADRELERGDSPKTHLWLKPLGFCRECGYEPREVEPGRWICPCHEWSQVA
jgi:hypothetical protein